jgi:tetratricopeptide (TPR) repeat protein
MRVLRRAWWRRVCLGVAFALLLAGDGRVPAIAASSETTQILAVQERLAGLLRRGDFDALDATIAKLQGDFERGAVGETVVSSGYLPFAPAEWDIAAKLDAWVARAPNRFQARLARGLYHYEFGQLMRGTQRDDEVADERIVGMRDAYSRAARDLQVALAARPGLPAAWEAMLTMAGDLRDRFELQHSYRAAIAALPQSRLVRLSYAHALWRFDAPGALKRYADEIVANPPTRDPRFGIFKALPAYYEAASLSMDNDVGAALTQFDESIRLYDSSRARLRRGLALFELGRLDEADADLKVAISLVPWLAEAHFWRGTLLIERGEIVAGLKSIDKAIAIEPMNPIFRSVRASHLTEAGRTQEALRDLDIAQVFGGDDPSVHAARSGALMESDPPAALRAMEIARRLDPDSTQMQLLYVNALYMAKDCTARPALQRYVAMCSQRDGCGGEVRYWDNQIRQMQCDAR